MTPCPYPTFPSPHCLKVGSCAFLLFFVLPPPFSAPPLQKWREGPSVILGPSSPHSSPLPFSLDTVRSTSCPERSWFSSPSYSPEESHRESPPFCPSIPCSTHLPPAIGTPPYPIPKPPYRCRFFLPLCSRTRCALLRAFSCC